MSPDLNATVVIACHFKGASVPLTMPPRASVADLKAALSPLVALDPLHIKLLFKGVNLSNSTTLAEAHLDDKSKVLVVGSADEALEEQARKERLRAEAATLALPSASKVVSRGARGIHTLNDPANRFTFHRLQVLAGFPEQDKALALLERIQHHTGVCELMKKHGYSVGRLSELSPLQVSILGFNKNKGEEISLRLRTEGGFLPFNAILKVLIHELTHMEISPHDNAFKTLCSALGKELVALDWSKRGRTLGNVRPGDVFTPASWDDEVKVDQGGVQEEHVLGHGAPPGSEPGPADLNAPVDRATLAKAAAKRLPPSHDKKSSR